MSGQHPVVDMILEYREYSKLKSTYVDALPAQLHPETGRVHTSFSQTGTVTGRLSSSDPNLQNIPPAPTWAGASGAALSPIPAMFSSRWTIPRSSCALWRTWRMIRPC